VPRPISSGGTGANNAVDAMVALGGEIANQVVTNYDTFAFKSGSFGSSPGATSAPNGTDYFEGICYTTAPGFADFFLEARSVGTGVKYMRRKSGGVWQPWTLDNQASTDFTNTKVAKAGDTMTGGLMIDAVNPTFTMNAAAGANANVIYGKKSGQSRWLVVPGNNTADTGGNVGSDFAIYRCADDGSPIDIPLAIHRNDGRMLGNGVVPTNANDLTNKAYVDARVGSVDLSSRVAKAGDTMTGSLVVDSGNAIFAKNTPSDTMVYITANFGGSSALQAVNAINSVSKDLLVNPNGGNVGIGTGTPGAKLDVNGTIKSAGSITANAIVSGTALQASQGNLYVDSPAGGQPNIWLRDDTFANKGIVYWDRAANSIGLVNPSFTGVLVGPTGTVTLGTGMRGRSGTSGSYDTNSHNFFWTGSAAQVWIDVTNVGNISITCDYRIKKDVAPLPSTWDAVKALKPISYTGAEFTPPAEKLEYLKNVEKRAKENLPPLDPLAPMFVNDDEPQWGFLAHELQETLLKSAASGVKDAPAIVQSPNLMAICAALTRALQEAMERIEDLETRVP
jgi:hypothetical protein